LKSTRRFAARTGSALALLLVVAFGIAKAERASYVFQHQTLTFTHISDAAGAPAVGIDDPGLRSLLGTLGAVLTWHPGARYVLITTAQPQVISFAVGQRRYDVGPLSAKASFAPFLQGTEVYLPLDDLLRALYLAPKRDGPDTVLQPQIGSLDIRATGTQATIVAQAGTTLHPQIVAETPERVVYEFSGVGSTLPRERAVDAGGIESLELKTIGTATDPTTLLTLLLMPGASHGTPTSTGGDFEVAFSGPGTTAAAPALAAAPEAAPPVAAPAAVAGSTVAGSPENAQPQAGSTVNAAQSAAPATVTSVSVQPLDDGGQQVTIAVSGNATYTWHRLRAPDNRFWIDVSTAQLQGPPLDQAEPNPLISLRVRQNTPDTVRVALSLAGAQQLSVSPSATGVIVDVGPQEVADAPDFGSGSVGTIVSSNEPQALVTPVPADEYGDANGALPLFGAQDTYVPTNPKLIVIDPGHGGSDRGAVRNGTAEAVLTLDMAKRLRKILIARGWQVIMTRDADVDVYKPFDSARDELQARCNIANRSGARLFVSIHVNAFINSGPSGTTTFYSKPIDVPLAQAMAQALSADGTKDDGIVKSHLYVTLHTHMPAVLIETAFLSNPGDYALLTSSAWRERVAELMADGIDQYAQDNPVTGASQ
jgi:N-acetylmuramoyl-L-alanine amidase